MNYRLVVTTTGEPGQLDRMLESFDLRVRPRPSEFVVVDGSGDEHHVRSVKQLVDARHGQVIWSTQRQTNGWLAAAAWIAAAGADCEWVFATGDEVEYRRAVELSELGHVLDHEARVAQMALHSIRGYAERRGSGRVTWLEHLSGWTRNPSLFRSSFARAYTWGDDRFGPVLDGRPETTFGSWGADGDPWVKRQEDPRVEFAPAR